MIRTEAEIASDKSRLRETAVEFNEKETSLETECGVVISDLAPSQRSSRGLPEVFQRIWVFPHQHAYLISDELDAISTYPTWLWLMCH